MHTIQSVGVLSVAKIMGAIYGALGLLFLPIFLLTGIAALVGGRNAGLGAAAALLVAIMFPVLYAALGFVAGAIGALLYNLFAKWVGGIEVDMRAPALLPPPV